MNVLVFLLYLIITTTNSVLVIYQNKKALELAISTWPKGIKPMVHYSESKRLHEGDEKIKVQAHSDYINELPNLYGNNVDVMVEAKSKRTIYTSIY